MLTAVSADFTALAGFETVVLRDARQRDVSFPGCEVREVASAARERTLLEELCRIADGTLIIAPECDGLLLTRTRWVEQAGGNLLGPSSAIVELAGDKWRTSQHLHSAGVPVPESRLLPHVAPLPHDLHFPLVVKPRWGAGSEGVRLVLDRAAAEAAVAQLPTDVLLEQFISGIAASVAVLCGPREQRPLAPCRQRLSSDGHFAYFGGALPLPAELAARATSLAQRAIAALPSPRGYHGVDVVLGSDAGGAGDAVIEINPRITTSYVGLRAAAKSNLAGAMWDIFRGDAADVSFGCDTVEFDADGNCR